MSILSRLALSYSNIFRRNNEIFLQQHIFQQKFRCVTGQVWSESLISELISYKIATLEQSLEDKRMLKV